MDARALAGSLRDLLEDGLRFVVFAEVEKRRGQCIRHERIALKFQRPGQVLLPLGGSSFCPSGACPECSRRRHFAGQTLVMGSTCASASSVCAPPCRPGPGPVGPWRVFKCQRAFVEVDGLGVVALGYLELCHGAKPHGDDLAIGLRNLDDVACLLGASRPAFEREALPWQTRQVPPSRFAIPSSCQVLWTAPPLKREKRQEGTDQAN